MLSRVFGKTLACALFIALMVPGIALAAETPDSASLQVGGAASMVGSQASGKNLDAAKKLFKIDSCEVIEADTSVIVDQWGLSDYLYEASEKATGVQPVIVHVASGTYKYSGGITIPKNVIFVAEENVKFNLGHRVMVGGSMYGGTYAVGGKDKRCIEFEHTKFSGKNGTVAYTKVTNAKKDHCYGIVVTGKETKGAKIIGNDVSRSWSGINVFFGATATTIQKNTVYNNKESGISIVKASAGTILRNTIKKNGGHGISTDVESTNPGPKKCTIKEISKNTIKGNGVHGVYLEDRCTVAKMVGNKITGNHRCGLVVATKAKAKGLKNNVIKSNKSSNLAITGKGAVVQLLKGNKIG